MFHQVRFRTLVFTILFMLFITSLTGIASYLYGRYIAKDEELKARPEKTITSQIILDRITKQYFVVTKTLFLDEKITIKAEQDSIWSNMLWGQNITASGVARIDMGVDMKDLKVEDIVVDNENKKISVYIPNAEVLDSSLYGDLTIDTQNGVLKGIFDNNQSRDYNLAVNEMLKQANDEVKVDQTLLDESRVESIRLVEIILSNTGYTVEIK